MKATKYSLSISGSTLRSLLDAKNIPIQQLAQKMNVSETCIYKWRSNRSKISKKNLLLLASLLGVSTQFLMYGEDTTHHSKNLTIDFEDRHNEKAASLTQCIEALKSMRDTLDIIVSVLNMSI